MTDFAETGQPVANETLAQAPAIHEKINVIQLSYKLHLTPVTAHRTLKTRRRTTVIS